MGGTLNMDIETKKNLGPILLFPYITVIFSRAFEGHFGLVKDRSSMVNVILANPNVWPSLKSELCEGSLLAVQRDLK